jgi:hypothetical protein
LTNCRKNQDFTGIALVQFICDEDAHRAYMERNGDYFDNQQVSINMIV